MPAHQIQAKSASSLYPVSASSYQNKSTQKPHPTQPQHLTPQTNHRCVKQPMQKRRLTDKASAVLSDQVKSLDWTIRKVKKKAFASTSVMANVKS
jgi:mRNA-degrading endonuclease toxin of MazEF toxin-antitoxin module